MLQIFVSLSDGLDRIHLVLTWLLGEFISIERFVVFIVGMAIAYLLTCSKYTARARPLLMMTIIIESIFLERCIVNWYLNGDNTTSIMVRRSSSRNIIILSLGRTAFYSMDSSLHNSIYLLVATYVFLHVLL